MKILLVVPHIKITGTSGAAIHHTEFSKSLETLGTNVFILADSSKELRLGKRILVIPAKVSSVAPKRFLTSVFSIKRAVDVCKKYGIEVIHDRCDPGQMTGYAVAKILNLPRLAEVNYNFLSYETKRSFIRDVIIYPMLQRIKKWWIKNIVKDAPVITAVSRAAKLSLVKEGIPDKKVLVVPNGANHKFFQVKRKTSKVRKKYGIGRNDFVLTIVGELGPRQGIKETVLAMRKLKTIFPNITLFLVGSEKRYKGYLDEIKDLVKESKLDDRVKFIKSVPHEKMPEFLSVVDVALAPYRKSWSSESFGFSPIKVFEYMAAGKVVVITKTKWSEEIIEDDKDGFLINLEEMERELEIIILKIIRNKKLTKSIVNRARKKIEKMYNWDNIAGEYVKIYKNIMTK